MQNTDGGFLEQVLLWVRDGHQSRFGGVFEVMMATSDPHQIPTVRNNLDYQESTIHYTSVWRAWWLLYLLKLNDQHYNHQDGTGGG